MADLDRELSSRLSRLAEAVPVSRGQLDPVHRGAVAARQSVRLAWVTPLVVVTIGVLLASALQVGPFAPAETPSPGSVSVSPWSHSVSSGDFTLTLAPKKPTFSVGEPLDVTASLVYGGPQDRVVINHLTWGPLGFAMWAPGVTLSPRGRWTCDQLEMARGVPITEKLLDLGNGGTPFSVPRGLHEIIATADFGRGSCGAPGDQMQAAVTIAVSDGPDDIPLRTDEASQVTACLLLRNGGRLATSNTGLGVVAHDGKLRDVVWPAGYTARRTTNGAVLFDRDGTVIAHEGDELLFDAWNSDDGPLWPCGDVQRVEGGEPPPNATATDGGFELTLAAAYDTFRIGDPIEVQWSLANAANPGAPQVLSNTPLVAFSAREVGGSRHVDANVSAGCGPFGLWTQGESLQGSFEHSGPFSNWSDPAFVHGFGQDRDVYLPVGTWVLSATTKILDDRCESIKANLRAEITITILPG